MAVDIGAVVLKVKAAEGNLAKYVAAAKELDNKMKKDMAEFQLVNQGLWEGKDHIKELEKEMKELEEKQKQEMKVKAQEVAAAKETFGKMVTNKIGPIKKKLSDLGQNAANTAVMASKLEQEAKTLHGVLDTATGAPASKGAVYEQLKKLATGANRTFVELNAMGQEIKGLANTPTL